MPQTVELEKFINLWWSDSVPPLPLDYEDWIEESYKNPGLFREMLFAFHQKSKRNPVQSVLGEHYDFYHDCILRHLQSNDVAYTNVEKQQKENWTYNQLHRCVNYHVKKWAPAKLQAGQLMALALPFGLKFLVALLTALRHGLTLCFIPLDTPFLGKKQVERLLGEIKPQHVVTEEGEDLGVTGFPPLWVDLEGQEEENPPPLSYPYKAESVVQISLSLNRHSPLAWVSLEAQTLYFQALRDALITLNLQEHPSWAAPLSCSIRTEPCSTLMTLLAGAHRVHVSDTVLRNDPQILKDEKIHLIGISPALQQLWSRNPSVPTRSLKAYYKSPLDVNYQGWKSFVQLNKLQKVASFQALLDNSSGGIELMSRPNLESLDFFLKPNFGAKWSLEEVDGRPAVSPGYGVFTLHLFSGKKESNITLSQQDRTCTLAGCVKPSREGVTFPIQEVEDLVNALSFVEVCLLHPVLKGGQLANAFFVLLVFVNPIKAAFKDEDKRMWVQQITLLITESLGTGFLPDEIECYPFFPKMKEGSIDRHWCANQYQKGWLAHKVTSPLYQSLHSLKKLAAGSFKTTMRSVAKNN